MSYEGLLLVKQNLSTNVKFLRKSKELSRNDVCNKIVLSAATLKSIENPTSLKNHSIFPIIKLAKFFGVTIDELVYGKTKRSQDDQLLYKIKSMHPASRKLVEEFIKQSVGCAYSEKM